MKNFTAEMSSIWKILVKTQLIVVTLIKGIFGDSNYIFLWHESEDINKKSLFPKFQLIPILH